MNLERRTSNFAPEASRPLVALVLLLMVAYWNSLGNDFVLDDRLVILGNQLISRIDNLPSIMVSSYWEGIGDSDGFIRYFDTLYRPLVVVTYTLNYIVGGKNPAGFHIVNLALHLLVTLLLYAIARQIGLGIWAAFISAALFGVHPIHTEAVSYVVGRAELMMAAGVLASLWLAGRGRRVLSIIAFVVGLLSKEQAIVLPLLVPFYEFSLGQTKGMGTRPLLARYAPYVLVMVAYAGLRLYALHGALYQPPGLLENPAAWAGLSTQVLTSLKVTGMYLWLFIWPAALSADYSYYAVPLAQSLLEPAVLGGLALWLGLIGLAGWSLARRRITIAFCVWMTLLSYLPVSNLVIPIGTLMGERLFYLPSAGLCLLIGLGYEYASERLSSRLRVQSPVQPRTSNLELRTRFALRALLIVLLAAMTVRTVVRNRDWVDHQTLLERTVGVVANNAKAHAMLGHTLASTSSSPARDRAIEEYQTALSLYPDYVHRDAGVIGNMSHLLVQAGRSAEARELLQRSIASDPEWGVLHYFLALHFAATGEPVKAEAEWRVAISLSPHIQLFRGVYGRFLIERGRYVEGLAVADEVLQYHPDYVLAVFNRALALQALGRFGDAATEYEHVLAMPAAPAEAKQDAQKKLNSLRTCPAGLTRC